MEFLKDILGDELYAVTEEKLKDNKDVKLANLASGEYVSKEKFLAIKKQLDSIKEQTTDSGKAEEMLATIEKLQDENSKIKSDYEAKLLSYKIDTAIDTAVSAAKAKNERAVRALLDESAIKFKDGKITGLDEQISRLQKSDGYLFENSFDTGGSANPSQAAGAVSLDTLSDSEYYRRSGF